MYKIYKNGDKPDFSLKTAANTLRDQVAIESDSGIIVYLPKGFAYAFYEDTGIVVVIENEVGINNFSILYTDIANASASLMGDKNAVFNYLSGLGIHPANDIPVSLPASGGTTTTPTLSAPVITMGAITQSSIAFSWGAITGATSYDVYRGTTSSFSSATLLTNTASASYSDSGLTVSTTYYYFVVAKAAGYNNSTPGSASGTTSATPTLAATTLAATSTSPTDASLSWTAVANATSYDVYRNTTNSFSTATKLNATALTGTAYDDTTVTASTTYYYWVVAKATNYNSSTSAVASVTIGAASLPTPVISFTQPANMLVGDADQTLTATSTLATPPITFSSSDTTVATIVNGAIHVLKAGTVTITAAQAAVAGVSNAGSTTKTVTISLAKNILVVLRGDSFVDGIGSTGTSSTATYNNGTQVVGPLTLYKQLQNRLNQNTSGQTFTVNAEGYPGETSDWFLNNTGSNGKFAATKTYISGQVANYDRIIVCAAYGTNDEAQTGVNATTSVDTLVSNINSIHSQFKALSPKVRVFGYPLTNRVDTYSQPATNSFRNAYNSRISANASIIDADAIGNYANFPLVYSDTAPTTSYFNYATPDVDGLTGVHPSDSGYYRLAEMYAEGIVQIAGGVLSADGYPIIYIQPQSQSVSAGTALNLSVNAQGLNLTYQWQKNGVAISGATSSTYSIASTALTDGANYTCIVSNSLATLTSSTAVISITASSQLIDWSLHLVGGATYSATNNTISVNNNTAWTAGSSANYAVTSGDCDFNIPALSLGTNDAVIMGLSTANLAGTSNNYTAINYGLYYDGTQVLVFEKGVQKFSQNNVNGTKSLDVKVVSGAVKYYLAGTLIYTSVTAPSYPLIPVVTTNQAAAAPAISVSSAAITGAVASN